MNTEKWLGLLQLETRFPRYPGDIAHPSTFDCLVRTIVIEGAEPRQVVVNQNSELWPKFLKAAQRLQAEGACAIGTSCGFLVDAQELIQRELQIPFVSSALLQLETVFLARPWDRVGILTIDTEALRRLKTFKAWRRANLWCESPDPNGEFVTQILNNRSALDMTQSRIEVLAALDRLLAAAGGELDWLILECANLPVHRAAIEAHLERYREANAGPQQVKVIDAIDLLKQAIRYGRKGLNGPI